MMSSDSLQIQFASIEQKVKFIEWFEHRGFSILLKEGLIEFNCITDVNYGSLPIDEEEKSESGYIEIE